MSRFAGLELGGTKVIAVLGQPGQIHERVEIPTTTPDETFARAAEQLARWQAKGALDALGVASFGPIRVAREASDYGTILATPKPGWSGVRVIERLRAVYAGPIGLDTDVNGAAMAEHELGAAQGCATMIYITIGTGLGAGVLVNGVPVHGLLHPELGHVRLRRAPGDGFPGTCPFHADCIEGLISGSALEARLGRHPADVPAGDLAWEPVAADLAELLAFLKLALSPQRIVIGGGVVMRQPLLLKAALTRVPALLSGYLEKCDVATLAASIVVPGLGNDAGPNGALLLARRALAAATPVACQSDG